MSPIIPIVIIILCLIGGGITLVYLKTDKKKNKETINKEQKTDNNFVNVKDIKDRFLYTRDGQIIMYVKINPISIDLLSEREKKSSFAKLLLQSCPVSKSLLNFLQYQGR